MNECPTFNTVEQRAIAFAEYDAQPGGGCFGGLNGENSERYESNLPDWLARVKACGETACAESCVIAQMATNASESLSQSPYSDYTKPA